MCTVSVQVSTAGLTVATLMYNRIHVIILTHAGEAVAADHELMANTAWSSCMEVYCVHCSMY